MLENVTLTDAQLAEIEADLHNRPLIVLEVDVTHLLAALRASREREKRSRSLANTWESQADGYPAEGDYAAVART